VLCVVILRIAQIKELSHLGIKRFDGKSDGAQGMVLPKFIE
jgi:hypothetical protein